MPSNGFRRSAGRARAIGAQAGPALNIGEQRKTGTGLRRACIVDNFDARIVTGGQQGVLGRIGHTLTDPSLL
jgi:hypothetical protein